MINAVFKLNITNQKESHRYIKQISGYHRPEWAKYVKRIKMYKLPGIK